MAASTNNFQSRLQMPEGSPSSFERLLRWLLNHAWYVYSSSHIHITLSPSQVYQQLEIATKPRVERLGLRKLYSRGRRYFIRARNEGGFQMTTTNKVWWHPRRRTQPTAILSAEFESIDGGIHRLKLRSRVKLRYLLGQFFYPTFFTSIIIFMDWSPLFIAVSIFGLYALSWSAHRFNAMLEAHEIAFYIETVLDDFTPEPAPQLEAGDADITVDDFTAEWDRYVDEKRND